jgi:hypothetical protein
VQEFASINALGTGAAFGLISDVAVVPQTGMSPASCRVLSAPTLLSPTSLGVIYAVDLNYHNLLKIGVQVLLLLLLLSC